MPAGESLCCLPTLLCWERVWQKKKKGGGCLVCVSKAFAGHSVVFGVFLWLGHVFPPCVGWGFVESGFDDTAADGVLFILTIHGRSTSKKSLHEYCIFCANIGNEFHAYI